MIIGKSLYQPMGVFKMTKTLFVPPKKYFSNVNRYTRAGKNGKQICCPECREWGTVYHFSWSALTCQSCKESVNKEDWIVEKKL